MTNYVTFAHSGFYLTFVGFSVRASLLAKGVYYEARQGGIALVPSNPPVSKKQPTAVLSVSPRIVSRSSVGSN